MFGVDLVDNLIKRTEGGTGGVTPGGVNNNYIQFIINKQLKYQLVRWSIK